MTFESVMQGFSSFTEADLARTLSWRGREVSVRVPVYQALEDEQDALVRATLATRAPEARRILALAQRAFGDLRGLLVGLPAGLLDRAPAPGEWPVREVLKHMMLVERRYALQTLHAVERSEADPVRMSDERLAAVDDVDASGDVAAILARLAAARAESQRLLGSAPAASFTRPTVWAGYEVDVRFRLHRFAAHIVEHTIQCEKTLDALGWRQEEGRRIARRIWSFRGELEGLGALDELPALDARHAERARSIAGG